MKYKPSGNMKQFLDVAKKETRVIGSVERFLLSRPKEKDRRTDVLHPSDMAGKDWCYRASYFHLLGETPVSNRKMSLNLFSVFEEGHYIHAKWQKWFQQMGKLYGKWYCQECGEMFWGGADCHDGPLEYREVPLYYEPLKIFGHSDGWLLDLGEPLMLEIKSIGVGTLRYEAPGLLADNNYDFDKTWDAIDGPFMKHITQVQIYMKLAELIGYPNVPQEAVIIYESKANQKIKEFVVHKSDFDIEHLFWAAKMICESVKAKIPPVCNIQANGCDRCRSYND